MPSRLRLMPLLLLALSTIAVAQYSVSYQYSVQDITLNLPTVNAWKLLPGGGNGCIQLSVGADGTLACVNTYNYIYLYNYSNSSWVEQTAMGNNMETIAVADANDIYALGPANAACGSQDSFYKWSGTTWTQYTGGCLEQINAAIDGSLVGTNSYGYGYQSLDGGQTWTQIGSTLTYISTLDQSDVCATNIYGNVYMYDVGGAQFVELPGSPAGAVGCVLTSDNFLYAWGSFGVKVYDVQAQTWTAISGSITGLTAWTKGTTFGLDSSGHPYHLNVFPLQLTATISGTYNHCPGAGNCPSGVTHNGTIQVTYPSGLYGAAGQHGVAPPDYLTVSSFDASPACDPFFGPFGDPGCTPTVSGTVICSYSLANLLGQFSQPPPPPPISGTSVDGRYWDQDQHNISFYNYSIVANTAIQTGSCGNAPTACASGTKASCPKGTPSPQDALVTCFSTQPAAECPQTRLQAALRLKCAQFTPANARAWDYLSTYTSIGGVKTCSDFVLPPLFVGAPAPIQCK